MKNITSKTIVFIHGAFVTYKGWDQWRAYFEAKGYTTYAPAWPHKEAPAADLRRLPAENDIAGLRLEQVLNNYIEFIKKLPEKPILIGHSYGGLITQLLVNRGYAAAAVAVNSVPPQGVFTFKPSFYKATWGPLGLFTSTRKTFLMSFEQWQYAFTNGMPLDEQIKSYEENVVPESKLMSRDGLTSMARIDFKKQHAPLLFISGSEDHIMPASLNHSNFKRYRQNGSVTEYKEFTGRNHFTVGQKGWEDVVGYIEDWLID